jgi:hypothetical protein
VRNITPATAARRSQATTVGPARQVALDGLAGELRQTESTSFGLVPQAAIKTVRQLDGSASHGMPAYHAPRHTRMQSNLLLFLRTFRGSAGFRVLQPQHRGRLHGGHEIRNV